MFLVFYS